MDITELTVKFMNLVAAEDDARKQLEMITAQKREAHLEMVKAVSGGKVVVEKDENLNKIF